MRYICSAVCLLHVCYAFTSVVTYGTMIVTERFIDSTRWLDWLPVVLHTLRFICPRLPDLNSVILTREFNSDVDSSLRPHLFTLRPRSTTLILPD